MMRDIVAAVPPHEQLQLFIDQIVTQNDATARIMTVVDEVIAHAHRDAHARDRVRQAFVDLESFIGGMVQARYPDASAADRATVTTGLILLLREFDRVRSLQATNTPAAQARQVRALTEMLLGSLEW